MITTTTSSSPAAEIAALQAQLTWMKRAMLVAFVLCGSVVLLGQSSNEPPADLTATRVTATQLSLLDEAGNTVVEIGSTGAGAPYLTFSNGERMLLNCRPNQAGYPFLALVDATGQSVATLQTGMGAEPGAHLFLENKVTKSRKHLSSDQPHRRRGQ